MRSSRAYLLSSFVAIDKWCVLFLTCSTCNRVDIFIMDRSLHFEVELQIGILYAISQKLCFGVKRVLMLLSAYICIHCVQIHILPLNNSFSLKKKEVWEETNLVCRCQVACNGTHALS